MGDSIYARTIAYNFMLSAQGFAPYTRNICSKPFNVYFFLSSSEGLQTRSLDGIFTFNTSYDVVLRKVVPFGGERISF